MTGSAIKTSIIAYFPIKTSIHYMLCQAVCRMYQINTQFKFFGVGSQEEMVRTPTIYLQLCRVDMNYKLSDESNFISKFAVTRIINDLRRTSTFKNLIFCFKYRLRGYMCKPC